MPLRLRWSCRVPFLLTPVILIVLALPRLQSGIALEAAFPVPEYMRQNISLPRDAYLAAVAKLSNANEKDPRSALLATEAEIFLGRDPAHVEQALRQHLREMPASARGWLLLGERLSFHDTKAAARALSQSLSISPLEHALIGRQARLSARLWDDLPNRSRRIALRQVAQLWASPILRPELSSLQATDGGEDLLERAFANTPETHHTVSAWVQGYHRRIFEAQ
jgi:hypothetical protein